MTHISVEEFEDYIKRQNIEIEELKSAVNSHTHITDIGPTSPPTLPQILNKRFDLEMESKHLVSDLLEEKSIKDLLDTSVTLRQLLEIAKKIDNYGAEEFSESRYEGQSFFVTMIKELSGVPFSVQYEKELFGY